METRKIQGHAMSAGSFRKYDGQVGPMSSKSLGEDYGPSGH